MPIAFLKHAIVRLPCDQWVTVANQKKRCFASLQGANPVIDIIVSLGQGWKLCTLDSQFAEEISVKLSIGYILKLSFILIILWGAQTHTYTHTHTCSILGKNTDKGIPNAQSDRREIYYIILITWGKSEVFSLPKMKGIMVRSALLLFRY